MIPIHVALFDIDGTLLYGQSYAYLLKELWRLRWRRGRLLLLLIRHLPRQFLRRLGLVGRLQNQEKWAGGMAWLLKGLLVEEANLLIERCFRSITPHLRDAVLQEMDERRKEGSRIFLASTAMQPLVDRLAIITGAEGGVGSPLEVVNDRYTGRPAGPPCNGVRKLEYLGRAFGTDFNWERSHAYSDGNPDLPMLERVGHPVAVEPDETLRRAAAERGWRIIR